MWHNSKERGMDEAFPCWHCGESVADVPLPLARLAECPGCSADLHVCRQCEHYDKSVARDCRESIADDVNDKERANFCGYFQLNRKISSPTTETVGGAARDELNQLFGLPQSNQSNLGVGADTAQDKLNDLFGLSNKSRKPD